MSDDRREIAGSPAEPNAVSGVGPSPRASVDGLPASVDGPRASVNGPRASVDGPRASANGERAARPRRRPVRGVAALFPQLVLFPLLLVTVGVLVYLFFIASAQDSRSVDEILRDLEAGGSHSRRQDAWALAQKLNELEVGLGTGGASRYLSADETRRLLRILEHAGSDDELRGFLVDAFGRSGQPEITWPVLGGMLDDPSTTAEVRNKVIQAISLSGHRVAPVIATLLREIETSSAPEAWETRWFAVHAIVNILTRGEPLSPEALRDDELVRLAVRKLRPLVGSPRREISWNTAAFLATYFADDEGETVLRDLLSWDFLDAQRGDGRRELTLDEKETWIEFALRALFRLHGEAMRAVLEEKRNDRSLSVRNVALTCLKELDGRAP